MKNRNNNNIDKNNITHDDYVDMLWILLKKRPLIFLWYLLCAMTSVSFWKGLFSKK
jgi:hypothetical protein